MSYDIHLNIPEDSSGGYLIAALTALQHITPSQAVERIIDQVAQAEIASLHYESRARIPGLPAKPMTAEEAAEVDGAMAIVMEARLERSERTFSAYG
jgi:hypothetical protein